MSISSNMSHDQHTAALRKDPMVLRARMQQACVAAAIRGITIVRATAREVKAFDTGLYVMAWQAAPTPNNGGAVLFNTSVYAEVIESGRGPGRGAPLDPLTAWVARKITPAIRPGESQAQANRRVAFAVMRNIKSKGIKARHVLDKSLSKLEMAFEQEISKAMGRP